MSEDPAVARLAPKLVNSISRAVHLCESTLAFGKAEEPGPRLTVMRLADLVVEVLESERLGVGQHPVTLRAQVPQDMEIRADPEQMHRVLSNLVRNASQAIIASGTAGDVCVRASETPAAWSIFVADTGPGLPSKAREHLFAPFQGSVRKGGSGLGLAISAELVRGHGGDIQLVETGPEGTEFRIQLPKGDDTL